MKRAVSILLTPLVSYADVKPAAALCGNEDENKVIEDVLDSYDPSTGDAQALMNDLRMLDSFNWGYGHSITRFQRGVTLQILMVRSVF